MKESNGSNSRSGVGAVDLRAVASLSGMEGAKPAVAWCGGLSPKVALERADDFISSGFRVELSWQESREGAIQLARTRGYAWWIDLSARTALGLENERQGMP